MNARRCENTFRFVEKASAKYPWYLLAPGRRFGEETCLGICLGACRRKWPCPFNGCRAKASNFEALH